MSRPGHPLPEARTEDLVVQEAGDEVLVYDLARHKAHCLNRTAALIWRNCDGVRSASDVASVVSLEVGSAVDEGAVWYALSQLDKLHLMRESITPPAMWVGMSRRDFMRKAGIATAVAVPVIISLSAPTRAYAASCVPNGGGCNTTAECCPPAVCAGNICV